LLPRNFQNVRLDLAKKAAYYMWKNSAACRFLGGRLVYTKNSVCKVGKPHQWLRVTRCVQGPVLTHKGFSYKHGGKYVRKTRRTVRKSKYGKCPAYPRGNALRSIHGKYKVHMAFVNKASNSVRLMWLNYRGKPVYYGTMKPGQVKGMNTYVTHPW